MAKISQSKNLVDTQDQIRINKLSVMTSRQDIPGLSHMKLRSGLFYCLGRNPSMYLRAIYWGGGSVLQSFHHD